MQVKKLLLSLSANDIRHCIQGVNHLKTHVSDLMKTVKKLHPNACVLVQAIPPFHHNGQDTALVIHNICAMNNLIFDRCSRHKLFYLDVFWASIDHFGNRKKDDFLSVTLRAFLIFNPASIKAGTPSSISELYTQRCFIHWDTDVVIRFNFVIVCISSLLDLNIWIFFK